MTATRAPAPPVAAASWPAIGTTVRLVVTDPARMPAARSLLTSYIAALDLACSRFRPDSEIARAERGDGHPVPVSEVLADAIDVALHAADVTDGDLDPTVATQLAALGYDRDFALVAKDGPPVPVTVRVRPSWRHVRLDRSARMLTLPPGVRLDLGATAKARAADRAAARLAGGSAAGCWSASAATSPSAARPPTAAGGSASRTSRAAPTSRPPGPPS